MVDIQEKLKKLSLSLPDAPAPAANYLPYVISNNLLFVYGQISSNKKGLIKHGKDQPKNLFIESNLIDIDYHDKKFIVLTDSLLLRYDFFD